MDIKNFEGNSHSSKRREKEEREKVEKVVSGKVVAKKKSGIRKFADTFINEDIENVKSYVIGEVLIPAMKKALSDIITNATDMLLYTPGERKYKNTSYSRGGVTRVSYDRYSDDRRDRRDDRMSRGRINDYDIDTIVVDNRGEALSVLERLDDLIEAYGIARVADFYDLVGITGSYTDNKYGWTDLRSADVIRVRDGYKFKLPRAIPID